MHKVQDARTTCRARWLQCTKFAESLKALQQYYLHIYIHTNIHTYIRTYIHNINICKYIQTCIKCKTLVPLVAPDGSSVLNLLEASRLYSSTTSTVRRSYRARPVWPRWSSKFVACYMMCTVYGVQECTYYIWPVCCPSYVLSAKVCRPCGWQCILCTIPVLL